MRRRLLHLTAVISIMMFIAIGVAVVRSKSTVPANIKRQVDSAVLVPLNESVLVNKDSYKYNDAQKLLSFTVTYAKKDLTITEQPTPESFTDIPQAYDSLVSQMGEYSTFDSTMGTVHLTSPKEQKNIQIAVMNSKGSLVFVRSNGGMTKEEWMRFFATFDVVK